ncbi:MAG: ribosome biogenesis GTPase Der [Planctomycetota bacterium]
MNNIIAIVGRPNVGKSTLFNALCRRRTAIVDAIAGTTRDRISAVVSRDGLTVELIDTGGFELKSQKVLWSEIRNQINAAMEEAGLILFLADIRTGVTDLDLEIAKNLRRQTKPVVLCVNKADTMQLEKGLVEFRKLGFGEPLVISALQKRGLNELWEEIKRRAWSVERGASDPQDNPVDETFNAQRSTLNAPHALVIAIAGKRNVGKSTLVNNLVGGERTIVSPIPGTTRDAIDVRLEKDGQTLILIDTAGILKKRKLKEAVEIYSQQRTETAIQRADVVLFMIDARDKVSDVDKKIAGFITENYKPCIIAVNKWDLVQNKTTTDEYKKYLDSVLQGLSFAPIVFISAKTGFNVTSVISMARELYKQAGIKIPTPGLNKVTEKIKTLLPVAHRGGRIPKIYYVAQTGSFPPVITLMTNNRSLFSKQAVRYIQQQLRKELSINEVPIKVLLKSKSR